MKLERRFCRGLLLVLALAIPALGTGQTGMEGGYDRPEYDPEVRLYGYPSLGIKPQFSHAVRFSEDGLARVIVGCRYSSCKKGSPGYNKMGKRIWAFIDIGFNKEPGTYDIFDPSNYAIFDERFTFANSFSKRYPGLAKVKLRNDRRSYFINTRGELRFVETENGIAPIEKTAEQENGQSPSCENLSKLSCLKLNAIEER